MARTWSKRSKAVSARLESTELTRGSEEMAMNGRAVDAIVRQLTPQLQHVGGAEQWRVGHSRGARCDLRLCVFSFAMSW